MKNTYEGVWNTLKEIDCSDHTEKKNGLTYLSWAWAWGIFMDNFPDAKYSFQETETHNDGSQTVHVTVSIGDVERTMWLPVMNYKNQAIANPSSRDVSDNKMRCLVKCLAMFGLGHYIYAGEDLPPSSDNEKETIEEAAEQAHESMKKVEAAAKEHSAPTDEIEIPDTIEGKREFIKKQKPNDVVNWTEDFCKTVVGLICELADLEDTFDGLKSYALANKELIEKIKEHFPSQYEVYKEVMNNKKMGIQNDG